MSDNLIAGVVQDAQDAPGKAKREGMTVLRGPAPVGKIGDAQIVRKAATREGAKAWVYAEYVNGAGRTTRIPLAAIPSVLALMSADELLAMPAIAALLDGTAPDAPEVDDAPDVDDDEDVEPVEE